MFRLRRNNSCVFWLCFLCTLVYSKSIRKVRAVVSFLKNDTNRNTLTTTIAEVPATMQRFSAQGADKVDARLAFYRQNNIAQTHLKKLKSRFIEFLYTNDRHLLQDEFIIMLLSPSGSNLLEKIKSLDIVQSLRYDLLLGRDFMH